jgi:exodeoxyribonuclease-3
MKIASFNINNINRRLSNLLGWLREAEPDIVCLQELKVADSEFPTEAIRRLAIMRHGAARGAGTAWRSLRDRRLPINRWRTLYGIACAKSWGVLLALVVSTDMVS